MPKTDIDQVKATEAYKWAYNTAAAKERKQCEYVRLCAERFLRDLQRGDIYFDVAEYARMIKYFGCFKHTKGLLTGERFVLRDDQKFFLGQVVAWKKENGEQRITDVYKEVARKNGKSWEVGGLAGYYFTAKGENEAEVYSLATSEKQAMMSWGAFKSMSKTCPEYAKTLEYRTGVIRHPKSGSIFAPLPSTGENLDGRSPSFIVTDEYHLFREQHNASRASLRGGAGARKNIIEYKITTSGTNSFGACYDERRQAIQVLQGTIDLDMYLPVIYTLDEGDDWEDERVWYKSNPALGVSKSIGFMCGAYALAKHSPRSEAEFKTKQLDLWTDAVTAWLRVEDWRGLEKRLSPEALKGKRCIIGVDLGETNDLCAFAFVFPPQDGLGKWYVRPLFFVPRVSAVIRETNKVPYLTWVDQGYMRYSGEKRIDMTEVAKVVMREASGYNVMFAAYDAWKSNVIVEAFKGAGIETRPIKQYYQTMSPAMQYFAELIDKGEIIHDGNPCMTWCVGNVVVDMDANGNIKPNKRRSSEKIDGASATLDAIAGWQARDAKKVIVSCPVSLI